jgi:hypothetical protein
MRRLIPIVLLLGASVTAAAQSLGEVAARTNKERKGKGGKVYTNDDLTEVHSGPERLAGPITAAPAAAGTTTAAPSSPPSTMDPAQRWRRDAKQRRDAIAAAEAKVAGLQSRLDVLTADRDPINVMDPNRLQTLEVEKAKVRAELDAAKDGLAQARQALEDLQEAARKAFVPSGWLDAP